MGYVKALLATMVFCLSVAVVLAEDLGDVVKTDGAYQIYANGIVKDTSTGLEWKAGPDKCTDWDEAKSWVQGLGGGWRMPTIDELKTLYKKGMGSHNKTLLLKTTVKTPCLLVWSSETRGSLDACSFDFYFNDRWWTKRFFCGSSRGFAVRSRSGR